MRALSRRELAGLMVGSAILAACGSSKRSGSTPALPTTPNPGGTNEPTHPAALRQLHLSGAVAPADEVSVADSARYAKLLNGRWLGGWHDSAGRSGTNLVVARITPSRRTMTFTASATGDLLGAPVAGETYTVDFRSFPRSVSRYLVDSPQFGRVDANASSPTSYSGVATMPPGTTIKTIDVSATRVGSRVDLAYTLHPATGGPVHGTMAFAKGVAATPVPIGQTSSAETPANIQSGAFAAGLLSAAQAGNALGRPCSAPVANGGNMVYGNGIHSTNALIDSTDKHLHVQYTVFLAANAKAARSFWHQQLLGLPSIPGPWRDAFFLTSVPTLYAFVGNDVVTVQVQALKGKSDPAALRRASLAVGRELAHALSVTK